MSQTNKAEKIWNLLSAIAVKMNSRGNRTNKNIWVFGEWFGRKCNDNCMYFANYLAEVHPEIKLIWIANKGVDTSRLNNKIKVCEMNTAEAKHIISEAGVVVVGQGFRDLSSKGNNFFGNAVTVNLWHGIPWKKIGHSGSNMRGWAFLIYCYLYDYAFNCDCYVIPSDVFRPCYQSAFGAKNRNFILAGHPRNTVLYDKRFHIKSRSGLTGKINMDSDTKIIAYMPTFRDTRENTFSFSSLADNRRLTKILEKYNAVIVEKAHFVNQERHSKATEVLGRVFILKDWDAQSLLAAADILITDYSGASFDYLLLDRPVQYYLYDYQFYRDNDRGLYFSKEEVAAGDVAVNEEMLISDIEKNLKDPCRHQDLRGQMRRKYMCYDSAENNEIIYKQIQEKLSQ